MPKTFKKQKKKANFSFKSGSANLSDQVIICFFFPELPTGTYSGFPLSHLLHRRVQLPQSGNVSDQRTLGSVVGTVTTLFFFFAVHQKVAGRRNGRDGWVRRAGGGGGGRGGREVTRGGLGSHLRVGWFSG